MTGTDLRDLSFAPRLGVAWDPGGDGKTSIRGGVGVFYNNIMTNVPIFTAFFAIQGAPHTPAAVRAVTPHSAAEKAGLLPGDRITAISGRAR